MWVGRAALLSELLDVCLLRVYRNRADVRAQLIRVVGCMTEMIAEMPSESSSQNTRGGELGSSSSTNTTKALNGNSIPSWANRSMMQSHENVMHLTWPQDTLPTRSFCLALVEWGDGLWLDCDESEFRLSVLLITIRARKEERLRASQSSLPPKLRTDLRPAQFSSLQSGAPSRKTGCKTESNSCEISAVSEWFLQELFFGNIQRNSYHFSRWICPIRFSHIHQRYEQPWICLKSPRPVRNS